MASSVDRQRLREYFERVAGLVSSDDEARLASPGVEGMVLFLGNITEGKAFGIEQVRNAFQAKEWAEDVDVTLPELEALVDTLIESASKPENASTPEKMSSTLTDENALSPREDMGRREESTAFPLIKPEELEASEDQQAAIQYLKLAKAIPEEQIASAHAMHVALLPVLRARCDRHRMKKVAAALRCHTRFDDAIIENIASFVTARCFSDELDSTCEP